jgi:hypothetical protein
MAHYMAIYHAREVTTAQQVEDMYARITKDFLAWKPADGADHAQSLEFSGQSHGLRSI